jgi:chemotaxis protein methyltransferase CheR
MSTDVAAADVERLRTFATRCFGLHFDDGKLGFLEEVLRRRASEASSTPAALLSRLEDPAAGASERRALARELTVTETYFFRLTDQLRALSDLVAERRGAPGGATVRVLSAGCASGEEPFSLAMLLRERLASTPCRIVIRAVDVNPAMLARAQRGRYSSWALRETPDELIRRWFVREGREFVLADEIRAAVSFEERNLAEPNSDLWLPGSYDAVFCRNVLMYFVPEVARAIVASCARALSPDGYLFLGHAETLRGLSQDFELRHTHDTFYYQRRDGAGEGPRPEPLSRLARGAEGVAAVPAQVAQIAQASSWIDAIAQSTARVHALSRAPSAVAPPGCGATADLAPAIELLRRERFTEALALVHELPDGSGRDPDVLFLRAVLLTHSGQLELAETACAELLEGDALHAGVHYLLALCREARGDRERARELDQLALHLDPSFAMARLHLGLLARRLGDQGAARRELTQARELLAREDPSRLLLFAGGFERAALLALCNRELLAAGGKP